MTSVTSRLRLASSIALLATFGGLAGGCSTAAQPGPSSPVSLPSPSAPATTVSVEGTSPAPERSASAAPAPPAPIVVAAVAKERPLEQVWATTIGLSSLWLFEPVVAPNGDLWVPVSGDDQFAILSPKGVLRERWGVSGSEDGQFDFAAGGSGWGAISFRPDGGFVVADSANNRVQEFSADRRHVRTWGEFGPAPGQIIDPLDIALDGEGRVYVMSDSRHDLQLFDPQGRFLRSIAERVGPYATVADDGTIYVIDDMTRPSIRVYDPTGMWRATWDLHELLSFATDIDVSSTGRIFVAGSNTGGENPVYLDLVELDRTGKAIHHWPNGAEGLAIDAKGDVLYQTFSDAAGGIVALRLPRS